MENEDTGQHRAAYERKIASIEFEREYREQRLNPKDLAYWTKAVATVAPKITPGKRPCCTYQWVGVLHEYSREPPFIGKPPKYPTDLASRLMAFAEDVAQPAWQFPRSELIEFALVFLEADVMLFRSGYTKRHLIKRLQQSPLTEDHINRLERLLRRSITKGTGLEEFRAFRSLAGHLVVKGELGDFVNWVEETAQGAILTLDRADGPTTALMLEHFREGDPDTKLWSRVSFFGPAKWGLPYPKMSPAVRAGSRVKETHQQVKYSAYLMLSAILRRQSSERRSS